MKIFLKKLTLLLIVCAGFAACGSDNNDAIDPENPITPVEPSKEQALSITDQKEFLEKVALEFMDMTPASDFDDIADLCMYINDTYIEEYDWDNVEDWADDSFEAAREALGSVTTEKETETWGRYTYNYNYIYAEYKALLMASNFTGHFTANNGRWELQKADDLQFIFTDKRGQKCVLKLETSGSVKKVYVLNIEDWMDYESNSSGYTYNYNEYYDRTQCTIGVPEKIVVTLTQNGKQVAEATLKTDLGSISGEEFDISKNNLSLSFALVLNNGYKFEASKVAYTANTSASIVLSISKNKTTLVSMGISADINNIPSVNVSAFSSDSFDEDDYNFDDINAKNAYVKFDVLGKVQIQGTLSDVRRFVDYLEDAEDNDNNEVNYKSHIEHANSLADINMFYNGNNVKQATIKLEPFAEETWNSRTYWDVEPVICFYDGSSYSTFEAFFNDKDFKTTIDTFKKLANKYADLVDEHIDW